MNNEVIHLFPTNAGRRFQNVYVKREAMRDVFYSRTTKNKKMKPQILCFLSNEIRTFLKRTNTRIRMLLMIIESEECGV